MDAVLVASGNQSILFWPFWPELRKRVFLRVGIDPDYLINLLCGPISCLVKLKKLSFMKLTIKLTSLLHTMCFKIVCWNFRFKQRSINMQHINWLSKRAYKLEGRINERQKLFPHKQRVSSFFLFHYLRWCQNKLFFKYWEQNKIPIKWFVSLQETHCLFSNETFVFFVPIESSHTLSLCFVCCLLVGRIFVSSQVIANNEGGILNLEGRTQLLGKRNLCRPNVWHVYLLFLVQWRSPPSLTLLALSFSRRHSLQRKNPARVA